MRRDGIVDRSTSCREAASGCWTNRPRGRATVPLLLLLLLLLIGLSFNSRRSLRLASAQSPGK